MKPLTIYKAEFSRGLSIIDEIRDASKVEARRGYIYGQGRVLAAAGAVLTYLKRGK